MIDYNKRLVEVDEVLNHLSKDDLLKIPKDIRQIIKEKKDKEYAWKYNETKLLKDQDLSRDTIAFLSYLNMEYLLNEKQKRFMEKIHELNEKKFEELKKEKYDVNDLFKKNISTNNIKEQETNTKELALVEYKESLFTRIINKIKSWFKK